MQNVGGEAAEPTADVGPTKRMRRPSVRLHQPYYENPGHRKLQKQWKAINKDLQRVKKPRSTVKTLHSKHNKNGGLSGDSGKGEETEEVNFDDDVAIGNWKNFFNDANRDGNFKRKRVRSSSSKSWVSRKSGKNGDLEIENLSLSSGGESGDHEQKEEGEDDEEENNLVAKGNGSNLVIEKFVPSFSFGNDDGNDKLSDDNNNVGRNQGRKERGLSNGRHSNEVGVNVKMRDGDSDSNGVRVWLNRLGLSKYAPLFKVHEVDDEVLPLLTLEDLKDMGINEVGPRRKMYVSIQKLSKGSLEFS